MAVERIEVLDHKAFGEMVVNWSLDPTSRPGTLDELKTQCEGVLQIPDRITKLSYVDVDLQTFLVRVPNAEMVQESVDRFTNSPPAGGYPAPGFYALIGARNQPPDLEILYSRIADYTIAQCF